MKNLRIKRNERSYIKVCVFLHKFCAKCCRFIFNHNILLCFYIQKERKTSQLDLLEILPTWYILHFWFKGKCDCIYFIHFIFSFVSFDTFWFRWKTWIIYEPVHEISNNVVCATSKASNQPAHTRSLIRAFASRLSILWLLSYWLNTIWCF